MTASATVGGPVSTASERAIRNLASGDQERVSAAIASLKAMHKAALDQLMSDVHRDVVAERTLDVQTVDAAFCALVSASDAGLTGARGAIGFALLVSLAERWQDLRWQLDPMSASEQARAEQLVEDTEVFDRAALEKKDPVVAQYMRERQRCLDLRETGNQIQSLLGRPEVKSFLVAKYKIRTTKPTHLDEEASLQFHKSGTTSIILAVTLNNGLQAALKILKPQYFENGRIRSQMGRSGIGLESFRTHKRVPEVFDRGVEQTYVLMEYVHGCTLREYFEDVARIDDPRQCREARLIAAKKVMDDVCVTLKDFATAFDRPLYHHDLSPDNLILFGTEPSSDGQNRVGGADFEQVWLIDWGFNYLLSESVGSNSARTQLQSYIDPALSHVRKGGVLADVYSLGAIYLEMVMEGSFGAEEQGALLDKAWMSVPGIAQLVEELIDREPCNRLPHLDAHCIKELTRSQESLEGEREPGPASVDKECLEKVYDSIKRCVDVEHALELDVGAGYANGTSLFELTSWIDKTGRLLHFLTGIDLGMVSAQSEKKDRLRRAVGFQANTPQYREASRVLGWMVWSQFWSLVIFGFIAWVSLRDLQSGVLLHDVGEQLATWPSRLVTLTFGVVASMYYMNMYSTLSSWDLGLQGRLVQAWMRFNSFCFAGPILITVLVFPGEWPLWSAVGVALTGLNNLLTFLPAKRAKAAADAWLKLPDSQRISGFLNNYSLWWVYLLIYACALAMVSVLLKVGLLHDEWFYGALAAAVNVLMMFVNSSGPNVRMVRSGLQTMYSRLDHAALVEARMPAVREPQPPLPPAPAVQPAPSEAA